MKYAQPYVCVTYPYWGRAPATKNLQWDHFITSKKWGTRWDPANVHFQCPTCNLLHKFQQYPYTQFMLDTYGRAAVDALQRQAWSKKGKKYTREDLQLLIEHMSKEF